MKNIPLNFYPPLARKAKLFLIEAEKGFDTKNRTVGSEEIIFYSISQALELAIKAVVYMKTGVKPIRIHDKELLANIYQKECNFSNDEKDTIIKLKLLNNGPGGLRYDNQPIGEFKPSTFKKASKIVERLLEMFE